MSFDQMMIRYTAPTLCEIKSGNLFAVKKSDFSLRKFLSWREKLGHFGIRLLAVQARCKNILILAYNVCWVRMLLEDSFTRAYLSSKGYSGDEELSPDAFVTELKSRIKNSNSFPHEIGIILGYPIMDVIEFDRNQGKASKYCGYWKSYSNVEGAKKCQCLYKDCSGKCCQMFEEGRSLSQIIKEYKKAVKAA